ncbi:hypothetical protein LRQ08_30065 (plasmid) [Rhodococcus qingshengii]|uniref:hypothetical protein n=1 Tax=Rhodococcus qingshengii TaxID=334542 RepID=UPI002112DF67|nr:hypothetical protein [Rhodococcus qingshengii]UUE28700.1 hypothetical protein LRQ08_30065 [Rhodococcus qingshengii]
MFTIIAMAAVATVVYAIVATAVHWIESSEWTTAQRAGSWVILVLVLVGIAAVIINADKDAVVGFCLGALIAPVLNPFVDRRVVGRRPRELEHGEQVRRHERDSRGHSVGFRFGTGHRDPCRVDEEER